MRAAMVMLPLVCSLMTPAAAQTNGVQVTPVLIELSAEHGLTSLRVRNGREREVSFETEVLSWDQQDGEDVHSPTSDIIIAPSVFAIAPGAEQIVRLALAPTASRAAPEREIAYRLLLRELPPPRREAGLRVQLQMSLPVFVPPRATHIQLAAQHVVDANQPPRIAIANTGNAHVRLAAATFEPADSPIERLPRYLLAGRSFARAAPRGTSSIDIVYAAPDAETPVSQTLTLDGATYALGVR